MMRSASKAMEKAEKIPRKAICRVNGRSNKRDMKNGV